MALHSVHWLGGALLLLAVLFTSSFPVAAQAPVKQWDKTFGGKGQDNLRVLQPTRDGGYLLGGASSSDRTQDKTQPSKGESDFWVIKLDAQGNKLWDKTYGGAGGEDLFAIQPASDGGYVLGGSSYSGSSGDKTQPNRGGYDYWVVKIDEQGNKLWDRTYGGADGDEVTALQLTPDGGYLLGGSSRSGVSGDKTQPNAGEFDYWVLKLDAAGNKVWDKTFGGTAFDLLQALQPSTDGGYLLGGYSNSGSNGDKMQPSKGEYDYWLLKLDADGNKLWDKTVGGASYDYLRALQATPDGGCVIGGTSTSERSGDKTQASQGGADYWLVKVDGRGNKLWDKGFGGTFIDELFALQLTPDGGYLLGGYSGSSAGGDKSQASASFDYWVLKLDASGDKLWDKTVGGSSTEILYSLQHSLDGGYLLGGVSRSGIGGDKTQPNVDDLDYWIVKLSGDREAPAAVQIQGDKVLCPNRPILLTATTSPTITSYRWNTGATTPTLLVTQPGTYSLIVTFADGQTRTIQHQVSAFSASLQIRGDSLLRAGSTLVLTAATTEAVSYRWSTNATTSTIAIDQPGTYSLIATYASGCTQQASLRVRPAPLIQIPNIITPNADRRNDVFVVQGLAGQDCSLEVYNRWGRQVYQNAHYQNNWGEQAAVGVYYYVLRPAAMTIYKGWVQVIR